MASIPCAAALAALLLCTTVLAQQAAPPAAGASAPRGARVGAEYTPGWDMMTAQERDAHRDRMLSARTAEECRRIRDEELVQAARRARTRGIKDLPDPRADACADY